VYFCLVWISEQTAIISPYKKITEFYNRDGVCLLCGTRRMFKLYTLFLVFNTLNAKLNPICHLLALLGAHHILHVSRIRVKVLIQLQKLL